MAFKKSFLVVTVLLAAVLNIQASFGMEEDERCCSISKIRYAVYKTLMKVAWGVDVPKKIYPAKLERQSETPFFREIPDEVTLKIFLYRFEGELPVGSYCSIALTCRKGYHLIRTSQDITDLLKGPLTRANFDNLYVFYF